MEPGWRAGGPDLHRVTTTTPPPACLHARPVDWGGRDQGRQADRVNAAKFGLPVLVTALAVVAAVLSSRLSERLRIPAPAFFLFAAAAAASLWPRLGGLSFAAVEDIVSVALAVILFDGGLRVGWRRLLAVLLAVVIRPLLVGLLLWPVRLRPGERIFVLWAGLKGAVPILLGAFVLEAGAPGAERLYQVIFVVVAFSVMVQGGTVPWLLRRLRVPLRTIEPEPWSLGIRFQHEPEGLHRFVVAPGAAADTTPVGDLPVTGDTWVSFVIRDGRLVSIRPDTRLRAGDEAVVLSGDPDAAGLPALFAGPAPAPAPGPGLHGPSP
jgi:NhaP-type Na+/H+ and K+/H+ antiporter